jgi:hypothetical protein
MFTASQPRLSLEAIRRPAGSKHSGRHAIETKLPHAAPLIWSRGCFKPSSILGFEFKGFASFNGG